MQLRNLTLVAALASSSLGWTQVGSAAGASTQEINTLNANNVCRVYFSMPKPGTTQQYEQGRKKHMEFHRAQKDTWTWRTFAIETGDNAGMFVTSTCGHAWKDFDDWETRMGKADTADVDVKSYPACAERKKQFLRLPSRHEPRAAESASNATNLRYRVCAAAWNSPRLHSSD
jgi:hypothetical protein